MLGRYGVRTRVIVVSGLTFAIVLVTMGIILWNAMAMAMSDTADEVARSTVDRMATQLRTRSASEAVPEVAPTDVDRVQQVWSEEGFVLATSNPNYPERVPLAVGVEPGPGQVVVVTGQMMHPTGQGRVVVAVQRVVTDSGRTVTAVAVESAHLQPAAATRLFIIGGGLTLVAFLLLLLLLFFAVRSALDPVERMRSELERISSSKERAQVTTPPGEDEIGRLGRTINDLLARLRRSDEQRAAFVSDAGHELRSPLATVALSLEQLRGDPEPSPGRRATITKRASAEVKRLTELVDDLLSLAASDEGRLPMDAHDVDLDDVVLGEVAVARAKGAMVEVRLEPVRVRGVEGQLQRAIRNLLDNGTRHAASRLRVTVQARGEEAVVLVDNDGDPVPIEDRRRIFARFVRLDDARDRDSGGSGLGLPIVASLVGNHGGTVEAGVAEDGWCRFTVRIPLLDD